MFAGVGTHKELHVAAVIDSGESVLGTRNFPTTRAGYRAMLAWIGGFGDLARIGVEGTGSYGAGLTRHLAKAGAVILEVDRPDRSDHLPPQMPRAGVDYPTTFGQFQDWFSTDDACLEYLATLRWPDGFVCPRCGAGDYWRTGAGLWMCRGCSRRTSVTAGTVSDRTRTPLRTWFAAVWFVTAQKNGVSALGLQRVLGLSSCETAWAWMHKLRRAMVRPDREMLSGTVEVDESFIGGVHRGMPGVGLDKVSVLVAAEHLDHNRIGRIRLEPGPADRRLALVKFGQRVVAPGSTIRTDGATQLRRFTDLGYKHEYFTQLGSDIPAHVNMPTVHMAASQLKRWIDGPLHQGISREQLAYYLDEFTFRFNRRTSTSRRLLFYRLLQQCTSTDPAPLKSLFSSAFAD